MGRLIDGKWVETSIITSDQKGRYDRLPRTFRDTVSKDHDIFKPESNRYHLYVSYACPWAHRCLIYRELKELTNHISVSVVHPDMLENGWSFADDFPKATGDHLHGSKFLYEVYQKAQSDVSTSVTVPILWDKKTSTIVNNESSEIIRIFNSQFNELTGNSDDYCPVELCADIDQINEQIYDSVNNGVYRTGFARSQEAYNEAVEQLFNKLEWLESHLNDKEFLVGDKFTEADIRLVPTLLRFDLVYYVHFKCNIKMIKDLPNLFNYLQRIYEMSAVKNTTNFEHIKRHYYYSHQDINPRRIIPKGPNKVF